MHVAISSAAAIADKFLVFLFRIFVRPATQELLRCHFPFGIHLMSWHQMNRGLTLPHPHSGSLLDFGPIRLGLAAGYNPARKAR